MPTNTLRIELNSRQYHASKHDEPGLRIQNSGVINPWSIATLLGSSRANECLRDYMYLCLLPVRFVRG
jgi:hypothetical protein